MAGWLAAVVIVALAAWMLRGEWAAARATLQSLRPSWPGILAASSLVLLVYGVLIWTWRECVRDSRATLGYWSAARIWFVSNLARYIPGALWQVGALALLATQQGTSATAATSAAIVLTVLNTLCGLGILLVTGTGLVSGAEVPWVAVAAGVAGLVALRWLAPAVLARLSASGKLSIQVPALGARMLGASIAGSVVAWVLYGVAFKILLIAVFPEVSLTWTAAIALYTAAYLAGFLSLGPPAGIGVADGVLVYLLTANGIADPAVAAAIAIVTRLWRTVLEVVPGVVMLFVQPSRGSRIP